MAHLGYQYLLMGNRGGDDIELGNYSTPTQAESAMRKHARYYALKGMEGEYSYWVVKTAIDGTPFSNPVTPAAALYEAWTGLPSDHETIITETVHDHAHLADLAQLVSLKLKGVTGVLKFPDKQTRLASNETGTQLFIRGGDQSIDLGEFNRRTRRPVDPKKELVALGEVTDIAYSARKPFLGGPHKKTGIYVHKLGGKTKSLPVLLYDTRSRLLSLAGGEYYIKPGDYDGRHSRGIVD